MEMQDFQEDVINASATKPVLVDFWAPWCGPCRILGPVLEKLADEMSDQWSLVKINSDNHPELSAQYHVKGIPSVMLFSDGEVVDQFAGALPEYAVRQWLDKALPSESKSLIASAEASIVEGNETEARQSLDRVLESDPVNAKASGLLASLIVFDDPGRARELARTAAAAEPSTVQIADAVSTLADALTVDLADLPEGDGKDGYVAALGALRERNLDGAIDALIGVISTDRYYADDASRKICVALFNVLGPANEITKKHRRRFDMALY